MNINKSYLYHINPTRVRITAVIITVFIITSALFGQQNQYSSYFPLKTGNVWVYSWYNTQWGQSGRLKKSIDTSITANGHIYYGYQSFFIRVDSINANVYMYSPGSGCQWSPNEKMSDSLFAHIFDTVKYNCGTYYIRCIDTNYRNLFGSSRRSKHFSQGYNGRIYTKDFGIISSYSGTGTAFYSETLIGCVINGVVYGDTSLVGVNIISSNISEVFSLSQNYPNPFNPVTKIKFQIAKLTDAKLVIFDVLGREIANLIPPLRGGEVGLQTGTYEVEWDAADYPSGVYFYKLITPKFTETKKMVLMK